MMVPLFTGVKTRWVTWGQLRFLAVKAFDSQALQSDLIKKCAPFFDK